MGCASVLTSVRPCFSRPTTILSSGAEVSSLVPITMPEGPTSTDSDGIPAVESAEGAGAAALLSEGGGALDRRWW